MGPPQASLDQRLAGFAEGAQQHKQRGVDMEKTSKKAAVDRQELQKELDELNGRSKGDAQKAKEVRERRIAVFGAHVYVGLLSGFGITTVSWKKRERYPGQDFSSPTLPETGVCRYLTRGRGQYRRIPGFEIFINTMIW